MVWWFFADSKNVYLVRISTRSYGNWIHAPEWYDDIQGQNYESCIILCIVCKLNEVLVGI
jgi:hypothetical protein